MNLFLVVVEFAYYVVILFVFKIILLCKTCNNNFEYRLIYVYYLFAKYYRPFNIIKRVGVNVIQYTINIYNSYASAKYQGI